MFKSVIKWDEVHGRISGFKSGSKGPLTKEFQDS